MNNTKSIVKEILKLNPSVRYFAIIFSLMPLLFMTPSFPAIMVMSYFFFQVQATFEVLKSSKDMEFRLLLPITRKDIVRSRFAVVILFQLILFAVAIPCALLASLVLHPSGRVGMMDTNFAFFGFVLIYYGIFNFSFLTMHFKTGYKWGAALLLSLAIYACVVVVCELAVGLIPVLHNTLDSLSVETMPYRIIVLVIGIAFYVAANIFGIRVATKRFEKADI